jgi:multidrug efflux pump
MSSRASPQQVIPRAIDERLPGNRRQYPGVGAWSGTSYQERLAGGQAPILYGVSLIVVFLCLAALYESWSVPVAVLLVIPLGLVGAVAW